MVRTREPEDVVRLQGRGRLPCADEARYKEAEPQRQIHVNHRSDHLRDAAWPICLFEGMSS